jgi:hypothetical protein
MPHRLLDQQRDPQRRRGRHRDRLAFPQYSKVLDEYFNEHVMTECIIHPYGKEPFEFAFTLDGTGGVAKTVLSSETVLGKCLVKEVTRTTFPRPPKSPFTAHYNFIKYN